MKKATYLLVGLALAGLTACQNLDEKLVGSVTTQYFATGAGLDAALMGDYSLLRGYWGKEQSFAVTEFGTDLETNGDQGSYIYENTYAGGLSAADTHYYFPWQTFYQAINASNAVIGRAPAITDMVPATKAIRIAEAKFLRALNYFQVVQMYGPAPLSTTEAQGASNVAHRTPVDSLYLLIV
jgi:starch-binding outer membrane protein, SusD/RagB family